MAAYSLNDFVSDKKPLSHSEETDLLRLRDQLYDELRQATALAAVASRSEFFQETDIMENYLFALQSLISKAFETYSNMDNCLEEFSISKTKSIGEFHI